MCFSTAASFGAGAILLGIGAAAASQVQKPRQWAFATIPALFAVQQISEGFVWLSLSNPLFAMWNRPATMLFLIFAQALWPAWVPFSMLLLEKDRGRRQILFGLLGLGIFTASLAFYQLLGSNFESQIVAHHIKYSLHFPKVLVSFIALSYGLVTIFPMFISSLPKMWWLGLAILVSFLFTKILFPGFIISVWCFFAAIISGVVFFLLFEMKKKADTPAN